MKPSIEGLKAHISLLNCMLNSPIESLCWVSFPCVQVRMMLLLLKKRYFKSRTLVKVGISLGLNKTLSLGTIIIHFYKNCFAFISILTSQGAGDRYMFSDKNSLGLFGASFLLSLNEYNNISIYLVSDHSLLL